MLAVLAKPYNQYQSYSAGEYILFNGSNYYICLIASSKQESPTTASRKWQQVFNSSGSSYITSVANTATINLTVTAGVLTADAIAGGGTVTSIATAGLISGGTITTTGTITTSMATGKLVGRYSAGTGIMQEITISTGLSLDSSGNLTASGSGGTVTSVTLANGTGISLSGTNPITTSGTITITNSAPDQTVVLSNGTGISVTGTYPNFTITNTAPDTGLQSFTASGDATAPSSTSNLALTLATVNANVGTFGSATKTVTVTANAKGLITAISEQTISITGLGTALTKTDDTNVTLTLGGSPTTALVNAASLTLGWTGQLAASRGGTGIDTSGSTGVAQVTAGTWSVSTALANGTTGTTQAANDNSTKLATTAYVDSIAVGNAIMSATFGNTTTLNPLDSTSYFWGTPTTTVPSSGGGRRVYVSGGSGVRVSVWVVISGTLGSSENVSWYIRKNNTTDSSAITTTDTWDSASHGFTGSVTFSLAANDYIELKATTPAWATNPTVVQVFGVMTVF